MEVSKAFCLELFPFEAILGLQLSDFVLKQRIEVARDDLEAANLGVIKVPNQSLPGAGVHPASSAGAAPAPQANCRAGLWIPRASLLRRAHAAAVAKAAPQS